MRIINDNIAQNEISLKTFSAIQKKFVSHILDFTHIIYEKLVVSLQM